ncbi:acyl-CoA dehydrogenase family protein [Actinomadura violacea]|uniref:Acyl-[acyl-carrier-protein] dehydrogenase MbtN n=1 Tax=Actinomadura violacea TaxID=2819934 RepID=A0ABS3RWI2_9ACTN|nr:acyl-CoA dehydrogenase [Actinomadura violacea]MBO2461105.1 acyl-CoA dehydrogenase [Actinomadura violacea]
MPDTTAAPEATAVPDSTALWRKLGDEGALQDLYEGPGTDPGLGLDPFALRDLLASLDAGHDLGTTLAVCVQAASALPILLGRRDRDGGTVARVAEQAVAGRAVVALAATDAGAAGSDLTALTTRVELDGDEVRLDGGKQWIVNATTADHALVLARHRPGDHFTSFTLLLVPADRDGVGRAAAPTRFFAGSGLGELTFDGVRLDRSHVIGRPGQGLAEFARRMAAERLASALWASALCRRVLAGLHERLTARTMRDRPLWEIGSVRQRFARALLEQRRLDALCDGACRQGRASPAQAMLLKAAGGETVRLVLDEAAHLHGADGFAVGGLQELRAEAAMFGIAGGTTETMLEGIADHTPELLEKAS